jgi:hypothetical protein
VTGHGGGWHKIQTPDGELNCPSLHHQMMNLWDKEGKECFEFDKIGWMDKAVSTRYLGEPEEEELGKDAKATELQLPYEPEIVWIPHTKSLCIQSHPEFIHDNEHPFIKYCLNLVKERMF